jgi:tripartite-type tricarboxylate transporter receptor subunit TctC
MNARFIILLVTALTSLPAHTGRLRALGVTTLARLHMLKDVPTIAESGLPGYEALQWAGLLAPANTPRELITRLHKEAVATLSRPELVEHVVRDGSVIVAGTPEAFASFIKAEIAKWAGVVKAAGIAPG